MPCSFEISCPFPEERWHSHLPSQRDLESSDFSDTFWSPASVSHHSPVPFWVTDNVFFSKTITVVLHNTNTCWKQECWSGVPPTASSSLLFLPLVYQQKPQSRSALLPHKTPRTDDEWRKSFCVCSRRKIPLWYSVHRQCWGSWSCSLHWSANHRTSTQQSLEIHLINDYVLISNRYTCSCQKNLTMSFRWFIHLCELWSPKLKNISYSKTYRTSFSLDNTGLLKTWKPEMDRS